MFIWTESLNLAQNFFQNSTFISLINDFRLTIFHSFFYNVIAFFVYSSILSVLYEKKVSFVRMTFTSLFYCLLAQGPVFLISVLRPASISFHIEDLFTTCPPYFIVLLFVLCAYFLRIDKTISVSITIKLYAVMFINTIVYYMLENLFFYLLTNDPAYQMVIYFFANSIMALTNIIGGMVLIHLIKKHKWWLDAQRLKQTSQASVAKSLVAYTLIAAVLYVVVAFTMKRISFTGDFFSGELAMTALTIVCVLAFYASYLFDIRTINKAAIQNQAMHVHSLVDSIDNVRMLQHDINNMMQAYEGFMILEDWENLRKYHTSLFHKTRSVDNFLRLNTQFEVNPVLLSLLSAKREKALANEVYINVSISVASNAIWMDLSDLSRIVGILLDNAIEETMHTTNRTIQLSVQPADRGTILLAISNPTATDVNIKKMIEKAYSSKQGHSGLGLYNLWTIVNNTPGCRLSVAYQDRVITFYLEIPCST